MIFTREQVDCQLTAWLEANIAVSQGQSYQIGSRNLTRANCKEILDQIKFWQDELDKIEMLEMQKSRNRAWRVVPID